MGVALTRNKTRGLCSVEYSTVGQGCKPLVPTFTFLQCALDVLIRYPTLLNYAYGRFFKMEKPNNAFNMGLPSDSGKEMHPILSYEL